MTEMDKEKAEEIAPTMVTYTTATATTTTTTTTTTTPPKNTKNQPTGKNLADKYVQTPYGMGVVLEYRDNDGMYVVKLTGEESYSAMAVLYTQDLPKYIRTIQDDINELNVAYEALEKMRRMNLEMECFEAGVGHVNYDHCTVCMLQKKEETQSSNRFPRLQNFVDKSQKFVEDTSKDPKSFPRLRGLWGKSIAPPAANTAAAAAAAENTKESSEKPKSIVLPRIQKLLDERQKASASPCLICASMSCSAHSSAGFRKENITLCLSCERLFELNFIVDCVSTPDEAQRAKHIDHMIDCYDRCLLLLKYSSQYIEKIAVSLEQQKEQSNKVGLGSSGVGVLSGVLGIAAAATILTPAGPPLLIASLFFGGGATAVQTGAEAMNYFSEPNKLADRIIALHGMTLSILRVTSTLRDAMLRDHIRTDVFEAEPSSAPLSEQVQGQIEQNRLGITAGANLGRSLTLGSAASIEVAGAGAVAGVAGAEGAAAAGATAAAAGARGAAAGARGATTLSRAGTAAARTIRFARFAGGALSAAVLVLEANAIQSTLKDIEEGNPCTKADQIRKIGKEISEQQLPSTSALDEECQAYLEALATRPQPPPEVAPVQVADNDTSVNQFPEAECQIAPAPGDLQAGAGVVIIEGDDPEAEAVPAATQPSQSNSRSFMSGGSSLLQRIQRRQERRHDAADARANEVVAVVADDEQAGSSNVNLII